MRDEDITIDQLHPSYRNLGEYYAVDCTTKQLEAWANAEQPDEEQLRLSGLAECEWYDCINAALNLHIECGG